MVIGAKVKVVDAIKLFFLNKNLFLNFWVFFDQQQQNILWPDLYRYQTIDSTIYPDYARTKQILIIGLSRSHRHCPLGMVFNDGEKKN